MWRGKEPPSCPLGSILLCAGLWQWFAEHPARAATSPCFSDCCVSKGKGKQDEWPLVSWNKAPLVSERAANIFELLLLPTPPLISFPSSNVLSCTLRSHFCCNPAQCQDPKYSAERAISNIGCSIAAAPRQEGQAKWHRQQEGLSASP